MFMHHVYMIRGAAPSFVYAWWGSSTASFTSPPHPSRPPRLDDSSVIDKQTEGTGRDPTRPTWQAKEEFERSIAANEGVVRKAVWENQADKVRREGPPLYIN
jgi:hypothetical protein